MPRSRISLSTPALLTLALALTAAAQDRTASITGAIRDPSGAPVPEAQITVRNTETGVKRSSKTGGAGDYTVSLLDPGTYETLVEHSGFKAVQRSGIVLHVNDTVRLDFALTLGEVNQVIDIRENAPLLAEDTSSLGQVMDNNKIVNIPLNGRSPFRLALITPGVVGDQRANGQFGDVPVNTNQDSLFSINGGQSHNVEVQLDGVPATAGMFNSMTVIPSPDAVQEFKVESNSLSAEWGRFSGGVVNVSTKSGGNSLHGSLFEFLRNSALDSNDFFNNLAGKSIPPFRMNQFGFAVGGPVELGKLYHGRNRTFFFSDYQGTTWRKGAVFTGTVPTDLQRNGDFSQTFNAQHQLVTIYDPTTTRADPNRPGQFIRTAFAGNVIPAARIDPVARKMITYYPEPNTTGDPFTNANNFVSNAPQTISKNDLGERIDHYFNEKYRLFGRFGQSNTDLGQPDLFGNAATPNPGNVGVTYFRNHTLVVDEAITLNATTLLDVRYGFARWFQSRKLHSYGFDQTSLGLPASLVSQFAIPLFPTTTVEGFTGMAGNSYLQNGNDNHSLLASLTKSIGKQTFKAGTDVRLRRVNLINITNGGGGFTFNRTFTGGPDPNSFTSAAGSGIATMLLGVGTGSTNNTAGVSLQDWYFAGYLQDDIRLTTRLTINLGLRYETESPYTERRNAVAALDPSLHSPAANAQLPNLQGGLVFATPGNRYLYDWDQNNFAPRIGLAYSLDHRTVIRAGAGLFYAPLETSSSNTGSTPSEGFSATTTFVGSLDGLTPLNYVRNPYPGGLVQPTRASLGASTFLGQNLTLWDNNARTPYAAQWNFDVQRQLPGNILLDVAYAGNRGIKLARTRDLDQINPQYLSLGTGLQKQVANPFLSTITSGTLSQSTVKAQQLLLPFPQYTDVLVMNSTSGNSSYHSVQVKVEKRFSQGVSLLIAYTGAKLITDSGSSLAWGDESVQNWYNLHAERAISDLDESRQVAASFVAELPFGHGKRLFGGANPVMSRVVSGWKIGGVATYHTGLPLGITLASTGSVATRPNSTGQSAQLTGDRTTAQQLAQWFNTTVFTAPPAFTYGNVSRTLPDVRAPHLVNLDLSVIKDTQIRERVRLEFRAESFNLTNTPYFAAPNTSFGNVQFGRISAMLGLPRVMQGSLKLLF